MSILDGIESHLDNAREIQREMRAFPSHYILPHTDGVSLARAHVARVLECLSNWIHEQRNLDRLSLYANRISIIQSVLHTTNNVPEGELRSPDAVLAKLCENGYSKANLVFNNKFGFNGGKHKQLSYAVDSSEILSDEGFKFFKYVPVFAMFEREPDSFAVYRVASVSGSRLTLGAGGKSALLSDVGLLFWWNHETRQVTGILSETFRKYMGAESLEGE